MRTPVETESFLLVAYQFNLWIDFAIWRDTVLGPIEDEDFSACRQSRNQIGVLRTVSSLVDFSRVVNSLHDVPFHTTHIARRRFAVPANLAPRFVVVAGIGSDSLWNLDFGNLNVIWFALRGMRPQQNAMNSAVLALGLLDIRKPLDCQGWPGQSRASGGLLAWLGLAGFCEGLLT